jgi:PAS domain S-box-containing protein
VTTLPSPWEDAPAGRRRFAVIAGVIALASFVLDVRIERGVATGPLYVLAMLVVLRTRDASLVVGTALVCTLLLGLGWWFSPPGGEFWKAMFNRGLATLLVWMLVRARQLSEFVIAAATAHDRFLMRSLLDNVPDVIYFKDREGRFLRVNRAFLDVVRADDVADVIGRTDRDYFQPAEAEAFLADERAILETGEPLVNKEEWEIWKDGRRRCVLTTKLPLRDDADRVVGTFGITRDVTAFKEVEFRLLTALESGNIGLWDWDIASGDVYFSGGYAAQLGEQPVARIGTFKDWRKRLHPDDLATAVAVAEDYLDGRRAIYEQTFRLRHRDGSYRSILSRGRFSRDASGQKMRFCGVHVDVTAQQEARRALERSNADLDQFAYVASHDLKAPLQGIDNLAQWIVEDARDVLPATSREHLDKMVVRVRRMKQLLDDLLVFSRIGRSEGRIDVVDLERLVEEIVDDDPRSERFDVRVEAAGLHPRTTVGPLRQVLGNLVSNAFKHHDRDAGTILVAAREIDDETLEFTVEDDGPGIPPEHRERVFDMFQQLRPKSESEGSGMGLAIVRRTVEQRGGWIAVEPRAERGTRFRFTWPLNGSASAADETASPADAHRSPHATPGPVLHPESEP